jgi:hypothetical protein
MQASRDRQKLWAALGLPRALLTPAGRGGIGLFVASTSHKIGHHRVTRS